MRLGGTAAPGAARPGSGDARSLNILYSPIPHGVLEYDDLRLLTREGHRVFSLGQYWDFESPAEGARASRPEFYQEALTALFKGDPGCSHERKEVSRAFAERFDVVIASGVEHWLLQHREVLQGIPVVLRTIGQSNAGSEELLAQPGLCTKLVRYAKAEVDLPGFARTDAVIYFGKDLADYPEWRGGGRPITFHTNYRERDAECVPSLAQYEALTEGFAAALHGNNLAGTPNYEGTIHHSRQFEMLADAACYLYVWSRPPSYTLSLVEAMLVGLPVVAPSLAFVSALAPREGSGWFPERYEVPSLLADGCGLLYDTVEEGRDHVRRLLSDRPLAARIASQSRARARATFDDRTIGRQWTEFLTQTVAAFHEGRAASRRSRGSRLTHLIKRAFVR